VAGGAPTVYGHAVPARQQDAAERLAAILN